MMTPRERFNKALSFEHHRLDRLPLVEWAPWWDKTTDRWQQEGLKPMELLESQRHFGLDPLMMISAGAAAPSAPAPAYHGGPIMADEGDYEKLLPHLFCESLIDDAVAQARAWKPMHDGGEVALRVWLDGYFWFPRTLFGIEPHFYAFYDYPGLMHRINADLAAFNSRVIDAICTVLTPDMVGFAEDMSYNHGPMLSRGLFNEFLLPYYKQVIPGIAAHGSRVMIDSDGDITSMVPWMLDAGIEGVYPLERQAGVDLNAIRAEYPRFLMMGGYDKMVMHHGEAALRAEFERLLPVMASGGYIASVDHQTPPAVSLADYQLYLKLFREYAERAVRG